MASKNESPGRRRRRTLFVPVKRLQSEDEGRREARAGERKWSLVSYLGMQFVFRAAAATRS